MEKLYRVYIAGPLNSDAVGYIRNCHRMCVMAEVIRRRGFSVYVPCLDFLMGLLSGTYDYKDYFNNSQPWLEVSDAVFMCVGWEDSDGCRREYKLAEERGIPVFQVLSELARHFEKADEQSQV